MLRWPGNLCDKGTCCLHLPCSFQSQPHLTDAQILTRRPDHSLSWRQTLFFTEGTVGAVQIGNGVIRPVEAQLSMVTGDAGLVDDDVIICASPNGHHLVMQLEAARFFSRLEDMEQVDF